MDVDELGFDPVHSPFSLESERAAFMDVVLIEEYITDSTLVDRSVKLTEDDLRAVLPTEIDSFLGFISGETDTWKPRILRPAAESFDFTPGFVSSILQVGEMYAKVFELCSETAVQTAVDKYHSDEEALRNLAVPDGPVMDAARSIISAVLGPAPSCLPWDSGRFGPGAVAEKLNHVERFFADVPINLASVVAPGSFPVEFGGRWAATHPSRMIAVPKTFTKPRLIAAEPAWNSWFQQALGDLMRRRMRRFPWLDITDQDRNGFLSMDDGSATIDQSRASDRVSLALVRRLFPSDWFELLDATRTPSVDCLCGQTHELAKFAGMGSATTFPVETLVFAGIAIGAMLQADGLEFNPKDNWEMLMRRYQTRIGFYGDDAIVPLEYTQEVEAAYSAAGFVVNDRKSYSSSPFRESCGVYSFDGYNVTPIRRHRLIMGGRNAVSVASCCSFYNGLLLKHIDRVAWGSDPVLNKLYSQLARDLRIDWLPSVSYCIDDSGPKPSLYRMGPGFGLFNGKTDTPRDWDSFPVEEHAVLSGRRRTFTVTEQNAAAVMYLCLNDVEQALAPGSLEELKDWKPVHASLNQRFSPRPDTLKLRLRR